MHFKEATCRISGKTPRSLNFFIDISSRLPLFSWFYFLIPDIRKYRIDTRNNTKTKLRVLTFQFRLKIRPRSSQWCRQAWADGRIGEEQRIAPSMPTRRAFAKHLNAANYLSPLQSYWSRALCPSSLLAVRLSTPSSWVPLYTIRTAHRLICSYFFTFLFPQSISTVEFVFNMVKSGGKNERIVRHSEGQGFV